MSRIVQALARVSRRTALGALLLAGCATPPPPEPAPPPPPPPPAPVVAEPAPACIACDEQMREIAKLRQDLASRDAEVRELRSTQREQTRTVQESTREVTRVKAKARRLATQAEAASYIAEVEVAWSALRGSLASGAAQPLLLLANAFIESTAEPFARGDYGGAMDRAALAEQLVAVVSEAQSAGKPRGETPLQIAIPFKLAATASLRRDPLPKAPVIAVLQKDIALTAYAYKGAWMRVATVDGRAGWVQQTELGVR